MADASSQRLLKLLGLRIRDLRRAQGLSQENLADKCGVHRTFMGTVERGESNLSFSNIFKVASTLGVSLSALFEGVDQNVVSGGRSNAMEENDHPSRGAPRKGSRNNETPSRSRGS
jgi:transcriptional regulator with XRE-family HTH domain